MTPERAQPIAATCLRQMMTLGDKAAVLMAADWHHDFTAGRSGRKAPGDDWEVDTLKFHKMRGMKSDGYFIRIPFLHESGGSGVTASKVHRVFG